MRYPHILIVFVLTLAILIVGGTAYARPGDPDPTAVPVEYANGVHCTLDVTSMKRFTAAGGGTFIDIWVRYGLDAEASRRMETMQDGQPPELDYGKLREIRTRYLFWLTGDSADRLPLKVILAKQYFDGEGKMIYEESSPEPDYFTKWYTLDTFEQNVLLRLLTEKTFYSEQRINPLLAKTSPVVEANEGFLGVPWGVRPGWFRGARHIADIDGEFSVYHTNMDVSPILGRMRALAGVWLVFSREEGLIQTRIAMDNVSDEEVYRQLSGRLGPELIFGRISSDSAPGRQQVHSVWHTGRKTRVTLLSGIGGTAVEVGCRDFAAAGLSEKLNAVMAGVEVQTAAGYLKSKEFLEASAKYDGLEGVIGIHWGTSPERINSLIPTGTVNLGETLVVFTDIMSQRLFKDIELIAPALLIFDKNKGFVGAAYLTESHSYEAIYKALKEILGTPRTEKAGTITWWVGEDTIYVLEYDQGGRTAALLVAQRDFFYTQPVVFGYL